MQSDSTSQWFLGPAGQALLHSELTVIADALAAHPVIGLPWLWIAPVSRTELVEGRGLHLARKGQECVGTIRCGLPWPIASESLGSIVLQHVVDGIDVDQIVIEECARVLVPGGRLTLLGLNAFSPYRLRWRRAGLRALDLASLRRQLGEAGLTAEPGVQGIGPQWTPTASPTLQSGAGLRAACLQRAEKRVLPLTPIRGPATRRLADPAGAAA